MYQDLSTRLDWFVKIAIVKLPIRLKGNSKRIFSNSLNPLYPVQGFQRCFADVTHRGLISSTTQASLLAVCQILRCLLLYSFLQAIRTARSFYVTLLINRAKERYLCENISNARGMFLCKVRVCFGLYYLTFTRLSIRMINNFLSQQF